MAKYFGIGGKRIGSVGNETYSMVKSNNVVKSKIIHVNDAKTPAQVEQRSKMENAVKAFQNLTPAFENKCFEFKKQRQSSYNAFISLNAKLACPFYKKYSADKNIIGIGNFEISNGSLNVLPVVKTGEVTLNEKKYTFFGIKVKDDINDNATVAQLTTSLSELYNMQVGDILNGAGVFNEGVSVVKDEKEPLSLDTIYYIDNAKQNLELSNNDDTEITEKGFTIVKDADNHKFVVLLAENSEDIHPSCIYKTDAFVKACIGYCGYFYSRISNGKVLVSTSFTHATESLEQLIELINANPMMKNGWATTAMKVLIVLSYGIKKVIEIINDWPI